MIFYAITGFILGLLSYGSTLAVYLMIYSPGLDLVDQVPELVPSLLVCVTVYTLVSILVWSAQTTEWALIPHLRLSLGGVMIAQATLVYSLFLVNGVPMLALLAGTLLGSLLFSLVTRWHRSGQEGKVLLVGYDEPLVRLFGQQRIAGVLDYHPEASSGLTYLGPPSELRAVVQRLRPRRIAVCGEAWRNRDQFSADLFACLGDGIRVESALNIYEQSLGRLPLSYLRPSHLLQTSYFAMNRRLLMAQAIYGNVAGLALLLAATPLLMMGAILVWLAGGPGPVLEKPIYVGFQLTPFQLLCFRSRRADGSLSAAGRILGALGLINLPQLINVVRGEMTFLGPQPVRKEFADRMTELIPFYPLRFFARPGWFGWAQAHLGPSCVDTLLTLEYDLFYVTEGSADLEIQLMLQSFRSVAHSVSQPASTLARR